MRRRRKSGIGYAFALALAAGLILFAGWGFSQATRAVRAYTPNNLMKTLPDVIPANTTNSYSPANTIRLHIPANSDSEADQAVKQQVKDAIIAKFGVPFFEGAVDVREAEAIVREALPEIRKVAADLLKEQGFSYSAVADIKNLKFPEMTYDLGNGQRLFLAAGNYTALQVKLGEGLGKNWWCVMYPPLCYFDLVQRGVIPGVPASGLSDESQEEVPEGVLFVDESLTEEVKVEVRSLVLDAIRAGAARIGEALSFMAESGQGRATARDME